MNTPKFKERHYLNRESIKHFLEHYELDGSINAYELVKAIGDEELANATPVVLYRAVLWLFKCGALPSPIMPKETDVAFWMESLAVFGKYVVEVEQNIRYVVGFEYIDAHFPDDPQSVCEVIYCPTKEEALLKFNDIKRKWYLNQVLTSYASAEDISRISLSVHRRVDGLLEPAIWEFYDERKK